jgi:hypothetical protein
MNFCVWLWSDFVFEIFWTSLIANLNYMRLCLKHVYVRLVYDYVVWGDLNQFSYIYMIQNQNWTYEMIVVSFSLKWEKYFNISCLNCFKYILVRCIFNLVCYYLECGTYILENTIIFRGEFLNVRVLVGSLCLGFDRSLEGWG